MTFSLENMIDSLGGVLKARYPEYPVYASPNQQGTEAPCFFIFFMPSTIEGQIGNRFMRDLGIDIVFLQQRNIVDENARIHAIAQYLDEVLELFSYTDGSGARALVRTFERQWKIEDQELHYQFHIRQRVSLPEKHTLMKEMEETNASIKEQ